MRIADFNYKIFMTKDEANNKTIEQILFENLIHYILNLCLIEKYGYKFSSMIVNTSLFDQTRNRRKVVSFILTLKEENPLYDFGNRKFLGHEFKRYTENSVIWAVRSDEIKDLKLKDLLIMMDNFINEIYIEELEHRIEKDNVIIAHETNKENDSINEWEILKNLYEMLDAATETNNKSGINEMKSSLSEKDKRGPIYNAVAKITIDIMEGNSNI